MKFSVFTVMLPELTLEQAIETLKAAGYEGAEWRVTVIDPVKSEEPPSFWGNNLCTVDLNSSPEALRLLKRKTDDAGLQVPNLAAYLQCGDLDNTEKAMNIARLLGAPSVRVGVPFYNRKQSYAELYGKARSYLQHVQELSRSYGVKGVIEIHMNNIASSASLAHRLVDGLNPEHIGVIYDPGNMVFEGFEQYRMGLELLGPYVAHVHVKNAWWVRSAEAIGEGTAWRAEPCPVQEGIANWRQVIDDLKAVGYDGWLSFEDFSNSAATEELLRRNIDYIRSLL